MLKVKRLTPIPLLFLHLMTAHGQDFILSPEHRGVPGDQPTARLCYQHPTATNVMVAGSWDSWTGRYPLVKGEGSWVFDTRSVPAPFGRHEYKFIVNDVWETGDNRFLYFNTEGQLEKPSDLITSSTVEDTKVIAVSLRQARTDAQGLTLRLTPELPIQDWSLASPREEARMQGQQVIEHTLTDIRHHPLPQPGDLIEARKGADAQRQHQQEKQQQRLLERRHRLSRQSLVDQQANALPHRQCDSRSKH